MANAFLRKISKDIGSTATTIGSYTVGAGKSATIIGLNVANVSTSTVTADVFLYSGAAILGYLVKGALIPPGGALVVVGGDQKVVLQESDQVQVQSSAATSLDAVLSILEIS